MRSLKRIAVTLTVGLCVALPAAAGAKVLRVGTYKGVHGQYATIQAAVNAAKPGDWVLVGPGDYKTTSSRAPNGGAQFPAAVLLSKPLVFVRGMSRTKTIVDGTKPGYPACSKNPAAQNYGPRYHGGRAGLNGIEVWKANNVWVQNLTTCNFTSGTADTGNEIWWNGGAGGGHIHGKGFVASYLTATSTFFKNESTASTYGLFSSDWTGGVFSHDYASNFNDSGFYIGGCASRCDQVIEHSRAEYNALGYSGTNSGGSMLIADNRFDHNKDGFDTNSQNNSDWPSPQSGACPKGVHPQVKGAATCWIFYRNEVDHNNDPNVPLSGSAAVGPVGTGASIEGRNDTFLDNHFADNGAWGIVFLPYPDTSTPPANVRAAGQDCAGGTRDFSLLGQSIRCMYDDWGNHLVDNTFSGNGFFGNPTNGDFAETTLEPGHAINCYSGNRDTGGPVTSSPATLQQTNHTCGPTAATADVNGPFLAQALCDSQAFGPGVGCSAGNHYPQHRRVIMHPLPHHLSSMRHPCAGVPTNPWCPARKPAHHAAG